MSYESMQLYNPSFLQDLVSNAVQYAQLMHQNLLLSRIISKVHNMP